MLECAQCNTLNPTGETACLSCGATLGAGEATGVSTTLGRCPAGHPVDPNWKSCPYCEHPAAEPRQGGLSTRLEEGDGAARRTRLEAEAAPRPAATRLAGEGPPAAPHPPGRGPTATRLEEPAGRATVLHDSGGAAIATAAPAAPRAAPRAAPAAPPPAAPPETAARRLTAVLAAPDLGAGGGVFAVRSGRNTLGSGRGNDVVLESDPEVSREHAVILHRNGVFHLTDRLSTNGTWLNDGEVPANGTVPIEDRDRIRLGRTELLFLRVEPPADPSDD